MPELNDHLDAIGKELAGLLKADDDTPAAVDMTPEDLVKYAAEQIALAKSDADPKPRLEHLAGVVDLAKAYSWEDGGSMSVSVYSGPLSVQAGSRQAEKIAEHPGKGLGTGSQAAPAAGAFESASGPTGPASNTAKPEARYMPPTFPQSAPAGAAEGWMAKAADLLKSVDGGQALVAEFQAMLNAEAQPGDGDEERKEAAELAKKADGWPDDLATESFLDDKPAVRDEDDFGSDPKIG